MLNVVEKNTDFIPNLNRVKYLPFPKKTTPDLNDFLITDTLKSCNYPNHGRRFFILNNPFNDELVLLLESDELRKKYFPEANYSEGIAHKDIIEKVITPHYLQKQIVCRGTFFYNSEQNQFISDFWVINSALYLLPNQTVISVKINQLIVSINSFLNSTTAQNNGKKQNFFYYNYLQSILSEIEKIEFFAYNKQR